MTPERAPSGYRKYSEADIERLRNALRLQRDQFLPLFKIRDTLDAMDRGEEIPVPEITVTVPAGDASARPAQPPAAARQPEKKRPIKMTRRELLKASGISEATLIEMERQRMVRPRRGSSYYGRESLTLCIVARKLEDYGMGTTHLRVIKQVAEREAGLVEQAVAPYVGTPGAASAAQEVSQLVVHAHAALLYTLVQH